MTRRQTAALAVTFIDAIVVVAIILGAIFGSPLSMTHHARRNQPAGPPQAIMPVASPTPALQPTETVNPTRTRTPISTSTVAAPAPTVVTVTSTPTTAPPTSTATTPPTATLEPTSTPIPPTQTPEVAVATSTPVPAPIAIPTEPVPILMFHYIRPDPGQGDPVGQDLSVSPERFAQELAYLAEQGYTTVTMSQLADAWNGTRPLPAKPVVLTFDDGYLDFYTNAWPLLRQYGFSATIYVIDGVIDTPHYLTWDMLHELDASGSVDIGSHTTHHPELTSLSEADADREIAGSKLALEEMLGHPVRTFCYPAGHYNETVLALVANAGYELAVTTTWGYAEPSMDHRLLPRLRVRGSTTVDDLARWL